LELLLEKVYFTRSWDAVNSESLRDLYLSASNDLRWWSVSSIVFFKSDRQLGQISWIFTILLPSLASVYPSFELAIKCDMQAPQKLYPHCLGHSSGMARSESDIGSRHIGQSGYSTAEHSEHDNSDDAVSNDADADVSAIVDILL